MEVVSVNAANKEVMRYRIVTCSADLGDIRQVLLFPEGYVGILGPLPSLNPMCCSMLICELTPPHHMYRLTIRSGKYDLH